MKSSIYLFFILLYFHNINELNAPPRILKNHLLCQYSRPLHNFPKETSYVLVKLNNFQFRCLTKKGERFQQHLDTTMHIVSVILAVFELFFLV